MTLYVLIMRLVTGEVGPLETYNPVMCRMVQLRLHMGHPVTTDRINPETNELENVQLSGAQCIRVAPWQEAKVTP